MELMQNYNNALQEIYDHIGFVEDWEVYAIDDCTEYLWKIVDDEVVRFSKTLEELNEDYYENETYKQRFYPKWVYRGSKYTLMICDTRTDGNKFFCIFDNGKEVK